jgi:hypothetical protein
MKKYLFLISACLFSLVTSLCMAQNSKSIEGTTWRGLDNGRETEVTFLPNGAATYSFHNGVSVMTNNNIKWSQNGNNVYWEINNKFVEKNGQVRGDTFSGTAKNIKGLDWTFSYKLVPPNAPPFNPSKELALEQNKLMAQRQGGSPQAQPPAPPASPQQPPAQAAAPAPAPAPLAPQIIQSTNRLSDSDVYAHFSTCFAMSKYSALGLPKGSPEQNKWLKIWSANESAAEDAGQKLGYTAKKVQADLDRS